MLDKTTSYLIPPTPSTATRIRTVIGVFTGEFIAKTNWDVDKRARMGALYYVGLLQVVEPTIKSVAALFRTSVAKLTLEIRALQARGVTATVPDRTRLGRLQHAGAPSVSFAHISPMCGTSSITAPASKQYRAPLRRRGDARPSSSRRQRTQRQNRGELKMATKDDLFATRFFKGETFKGPLTSRYKRASAERIKDNEGVAKEKLVLFFVGQKQPLVCNATNFDMIAELTGQLDSDFWVGHKSASTPRQRR